MRFILSLRMNSIFITSRPGSSQYMYATSCEAGNRDIEGSNLED